MFSFTIVVVGFDESDDDDDLDGLGGGGGGGLFGGGGASLFGESNAPSFDLFGDGGGMIGCFVVQTSVVSRRDSIVFSCCETYCCQKRESKEGKSCREEQVEEGEKSCRG
jgi:hypothetical protein